MPFMACWEFLEPKTVRKSFTLGRTMPQPLNQRVDTNAPWSHFVMRILFMVLGLADILTRATEGVLGQRRGWWPIME